MLLCRRMILNMKKIVSLVLGLLLTVALFSGCDADDSSVSDSSNANISDSQSTDAAIILADDDYVTATFEKMYDASSIGIEGVFYIDVYVKNKTDKKIWVYLDNASVNGETVPLVTSGVPLYIQPTNAGRNGFIFSFSSLSIDSIDEVKNVAFDLVIADEDSLDEIERIKSVNLEF